MAKISVTASPAIPAAGYWLNFRLNLFVGQDVMFRFRYVTDGSQNTGGWYIDDIYPVEYCTTSVMLTDSDTDTTFLVTDLEPGDHYYKVRAKDGQNQYSNFSPLGMTRMFPT